MTVNSDGGKMMDPESDTVQTGYRTKGEQIADLMKAGDSLVTDRNTRETIPEKELPIIKYAGPQDQLEAVDQTRSYKKTLQNAEDRVKTRQQQNKDAATKLALEKAALWDAEQERLKNQPKAAEQPQKG